ncbi:GspH/FimT family pseudopilin [Longimicrobium sp.]|uniref:GspH/FimT family pseudopilin n=1 Tax=Longimicrobium sp. TaxID=2029185 RepID=UPI003B3A4D30
MTSANIVRHRDRRGGYTLTELLIVLIVAAIISSMALPRFFSFIRHLNARSATSRVVADLTMARTQAVREGRSVSLRMTGASTYQITVDNGAAVLRTIKTVDVRGGQRDVSLAPTAARVIFDSRGMLTAASAQQLRVVRLGKVDTVSISAVGRVYRGGN